MSIHRILVAALLAAGLPRMAGAELPVDRWVSVSSLAGAVVLDPALDDYRWDVTPQASWGLQAEAGKGRWSAGLRVTRAATRQATGIAGEQREPTVRLTSLEAVTRIGLARWGGLALLGALHGGWLHLGYSPDALTLDPLGAGAPVEVRYAPIDEAIVGAELALQRTLGSGLALGLHTDRSYFWLDTSHRNGTDIEERRERFGNWTVRAQVSWTWARP